MTSFMDQNRSSEEGSQNTIIHQETSFEESQGSGERGETIPARVQIPNDNGSIHIYHQNIIFLTN